jgi:hypothetical protein
MVAWSKQRKKTYEKIIKCNKEKEVICFSYDKGLYASLNGKVRDISVSPNYYAIVG